MRKYVVLFCFMLAIIAFAQEGYPSGYFYFIFRGDTVCIEPVITDSTTEADWFSYTSASMHTGLETPYETHTFFFYNPFTGNIGMVVQHNVDEIGTRDATCRLWLDGLPTGCSVAVSDDSGEFDLSSYPQGDWAWWDNTDGGAFYLPRDEWQYTMRFNFGSIDPIRSQWILSGADGDDRIRLDTVYIDQEDTIIVGHGFLESLPMEDFGSGDSVLIGHTEHYGLAVCNSDETTDTLGIGRAWTTDPSHFTVTSRPTRLAPGDCGAFEIEFTPTYVGDYFDTLYYITNMPCDTLQAIPIYRRGVEARANAWFAEETDCDGENIVELCYHLMATDDYEFDNVTIRMSSDDGATWDVPLETLTDFDGDIGPGVEPGEHCITWNYGEDLPDYESCDFVFEVNAEVPGVFMELASTFDDFSEGEMINIDILTPDPDSLDDGALYIPEGGDTIYVLQVYPDGHCTNCMSSAIYSYMSTGTPPLNIRIFIMPMSQFNSQLASGSDESELTCRYINPSGTTGAEETFAMHFFDIIMFGVADSYGGTAYDLTGSSANALRSFARRGKGLLFSHDTIACSSGYCMDRGFCTLSDVSGLSCVMSGSWRSFSTVNRVITEDLTLLERPFAIPETFSVLNCHWKGQVVEDGWVLYTGSGTPASADDNLLYWHAYHNTEYNSFSSFYSYGHVESAPSEWEAKAMINSIFYSFHGGVGTGVYTSEAIPFSGGRVLADMNWSATNPHCGGTMTFEIAADTCLGSAECWTTWMSVPEPHDLPDMSSFDQIKYRVGMSGGYECESPVLHWISLEVFDTTIVTASATGCLDSWAPRISLECSPDTFVMYDTIHFEWSIEDLLIPEGDPCSVFVSYCDMTDTFVTSDENLYWPVPDRYCDSTWAEISIVSRDTFCNYSEEYCSVYCMPLWYINLHTEADIACPGDTILVAVRADSIEHGWIERTQMTLSFEPGILMPLNVIPSELTEGWTVEDSRTEETTATIAFTISSDTPIPACDGGILFYIEAYVPERAIGGDFCEMEILEAEFNRGNPLPIIDNGLFAVCLQPDTWLGVLYLHRPGREDKALILSIGATPEASDGYDPGLDLIILPATPEDIDAYIVADDPLYPHFDRLRRDFRSIETPQEWIIPTAGETDIVVRWERERFSEGRYIMNGRYDMRVDSVAYLGLNDTIYIEWSMPEVAIQELPFYTGWNLVSLPVIPVSSRAEDVFSFSPVNPFGYNSETSGYFTVENVDIGSGYWVFSESDTEIVFAGMPADTFVKDINPGWNLVGATYSERALAEICSSPDAIMAGRPYFYNARSAAYEYADFYTPGIGYWLLATESGVMSNPSGTRFCRMIPISEDIEMARIRLNNSTTSEEIEFGVSYNSKVSLDVFDRGYPPIPPNAQKPLAVFNRDQFTLRRDISPEGSFDLTVNEQIDVEFVLPEDMICLVDGKDSRTVTSLNTGVYKVEIVNAMPNEFELAKIYPNPFNSTVTIEYNGVAYCDIFDVLGSKVKTLEFENGIAQWDGSDDNDQPVISGIYLVNIVSENHNQTNRIILVR